MPTPAHHSPSCTQRHGSKGKLQAVCGPCAMRYPATPVAARVETTEGRHLECGRAGGRAVLHGAVLHDERVADAHVRPEVQRRQAQRGQRPAVATLVATGTCVSSDARAGTLPCFLLASSS